MPYILGIVFILYTRLECNTGFILQIVVVCFLCLIFAYHFLRTNFRLRWISGVFASISLFLLGLSSVLVIDQKSKTTLMEAGKPLPPAMFLCRIDESPVKKLKTSNGIAMVLAEMDSLGQWHPQKIKIRVSFRNDSLRKPPAYGDLIVISGSLQAIPGPQNPHMFNFRQYLFNRQINWQVYLEPGQWTHVGHEIANPVIFWAEICRNSFLETLRKFKVEGQEFALVSALLLGSKDYLESEVIQEFSHAGAIHVLSVSGLHVGIMYVLADKMLFFLKRGRNSRKLHQMLIILSIWAYAFITGLPSSVIRAALMFSLIAVAKMFKRSSESYNILAVAAFFQLWINPYEMTQVGFQLSYLAVLGIFAFYQPFNELIDNGNRLFSWVWSIFAVSMAAQLATFPLAGFYFNMFPVYFLLTNLIVVPLAAVVTYFAVALLAVGAAGLTFEWLALPLKWSLRFMQGSVEMIQSWPGAVIEPIVFNQLQVLLIYTAILSSFAFFILAYRKWAFVFLGSCLLFLVISAFNLYQMQKTTEIIVYQVPGHTAIDLVHNRQAIFIADSLLSTDEAKIKFQVQPNRLKNLIGDVKVIKISDHVSLSSPGAWINYPFIYFRGKTIMVVDNNWKHTDPAKIIECDLVIISGNPQIDHEELIKQPGKKEIIIDSSVPQFRSSQLMQIFQKEGVPCHLVKHSGAFVIKW
jgi:competence protein ComEC